MLGSKRLSVLLTGVLLFGTSFCFQPAQADPIPPQIMVDIYDPPIPFEALDKFYLVYELYLTNFDKDDISLEALEIHDKATGTALVGYDKESLKKMMYAPNTMEADQSNIISPGALKLVYLTIPFNSLNDMPKEFFHRLNFLRMKDKTQQDMETLTLFVGKPIQVMIRPPVRGDFWVAANGLSSYSRHRRNHMVANGQSYFPQRYAIDFRQIDLDGKTHQGDGSNNAQYYSYGKEVYSVARGTVVAVKDGIPDNTPGSKLSSDNLESLNGNYVLLELGKGIYALYGNLMPGSIKVKVDDKISEGQEIAKIGNSGNSLEPQLHFHVVDRSSYLAGNGVPYTFTEFWFRPSDTVQNEQGLEVKFKESPNGLKRYSNQMILENMVVKFHDDQKNAMGDMGDNSGSEDQNNPKLQTFDRAPISIEENLSR